MSNYGKLLATHLAQELGSSIDEVTKALDSFSISSPVKSTGKKTTASKESKSDTPKETKAKKKTEGDVHTCCRIKKGQKEPCGKPAKKSIQDGDNELFYCGADKSGCYVMALKEHAKKDMAMEAGKKAPKASTATTVSKSASKPKISNAKERKSEANAKTQSLIAKVIQKKELTGKKINTKSHGPLYIDHETRFLIDPESKEVYGHLANDNDTIEKLTDMQIRQIEASGHHIKEYNPTIKGSKKIEPEATVESDNSSDEMSSDSSSSDAVGDIVDENTSMSSDDESSSDMTSSDSSSDSS